MLIKQGIRDFIYYHEDCIGYMRAYNPDSCFKNKIVYLIWTSKNDACIQRFDECKDYEVRTMKVNLVKLISNNYSQFKHEKNLYPQYADIINGKKVLSTALRDHSCHHIFDAAFSQGKSHLDIDEFALLTERVDEGKRLNLNYKRNQHSLSKKLYNIIEKESY